MPLPDRDDRREIALIVGTTTAGAIALILVAVSTLVIRR